MAEQETIGVGLIGLGTVGGGVAKLLRDEADLYTRRCGKRIVVRRVLVRDVAKARAGGLVDADLVTGDASQFLATAGMQVVVEAAGGKGAISQAVRSALSAGKHVITANKALLAAEGAELFALARSKNVSIAFEASVAGGIPIITATQFGLMANRVQAVYGILNGTCNYILTEMVQKGKSYSVALKEAQDAGYAEADPTLDVSGRDAAQKLAVLASLAFGVRIDDAQVWSEGIDTLDLADIRFAGELGYNIKLLAIAQRVSGDAVSVRVHPSFIHNSLPLAQVNGSFNAVSVLGHANGHTMYYGRGAGQMPTASAVVSDLLNVASGWYPRAFAAMNLWSDAQPIARIVDPADLVSRYYLRLGLKDVPGVIGKVSTILGDCGISISAILQHEANAGRSVPVVVTTHEARGGSLADALARIQKLDVVSGKPVAIRIVDLPQG